jgi:hypothetical protein
VTKLQNDGSARVARAPLAASQTHAQLSSSGMVSVLMLLLLLLLLMLLLSVVAASGMWPTPWTTPNT